MMHALAAQVDLKLLNALETQPKRYFLLFTNHSVEEILFVCEQIALFYRLNASEAPAAVL
jgi:hypothetical protein